MKALTVADYAALTEDEIWKLAIEAASTVIGDGPVCVGYLDRELIPVMQHTSGPDCKGCRAVHAKLTAVYTFGCDNDSAFRDAPSAPIFAYQIGWAVPGGVQLSAVARLKDGSWQERQIIVATHAKNNSESSGPLNILVARTVAATAAYLWTMNVQAKDRATAAEQTGS